MTRTLGGFEQQFEIKKTKNFYIALCLLRKGMVVFGARFLVMSGSRAIFVKHGSSFHPMEFLIYLDSKFKKNTRHLLRFD